MRDPFTWALPLGRFFGVTVRVHILFLLFVLVMWLKALPREKPDSILQTVGPTWMLALMGLLFLSVLLHEFGHCFAAHQVDGDADEVLLWPLGGLARCELPHSPWAHFVTAAGGPLVNVLLCVLSGAALIACSFQPSFSPWPDQCWYTVLHNFADGKIWGSQWAPARLATETLPTWQYLLAQFFWVNWVMLLVNVLLIGFPMDGGRMLQATLWPRLGFRTATRTAIFVGFLVMFVVGVYALLSEELMVLCLAGFIYVACKQEWINLEMGGEESLFGYDFSQGYTSLERDQPLPPPRKKRPNFLQRWLKQRAAKKLQRRQEQQEADESRMDALLEKIAREGKQALTDEEQRFLKRVSDRYRNRH
jgi:stage IV sporulation protein FB